MNETGQNRRATDRQTGWAPHLFLLLCIAMCAAVAGWAYVGKLDVVSMATGEVVPFSQIKTVQHLEGGIVSEILVREGQQVKKDQPIIVLEATASGADVGELQINVTALRVEIARLEAEATGAEEPDFAPDLVNERVDLVAQAVDFFNARRNSLKNRVARQNESIAQRKQDIREITARIKNQKGSLILLDEQIAISVELLKENLTNRFKHLDLLKDASRLKGSIEEDHVALKRSHAALKEAQAELSGIDTAFAEEARTELEDKRRRLDELNQRLGKFQDSLKRTTLRSPVDGVVKTLHVFTRGGVVRPGGDVVEIVPGEDRLVVEARLPIQDIGYVKPGQVARLKLASADAVRFGSLEGTVTVVSPDTLITQQGQAFYKVRLETEQTYFERGPVRYQLYPGMQIMASILTGERTVLEYLLTPFLYAMDSALEER
ncbi:MAG: HlyD family type I secretion periplasmic adaptor subunit [Rhodospirillales bacterium]|jgi:membrane fusion protein, adhesin transport system|nr:HlyD family type I secretion periplasmic adaptor subunit [Rhodospirillales bacterium]